MFNIRRGRGQPVYLQLVEQIERRIAAGNLPPGEALPSVRALAADVGINPNTVVRAYRELEARGLVESRHGQGTFVAEDGGGKTAKRILADHANRYVKAAQELGVGESEAMGAVVDAWKKGETQ